MLQAKDLKNVNVPDCRIMEICGTHTFAIARSGLKQFLPENVSLVSGPGCPVCVTPAGVIDAVLSLSEKKDVIITTYGDLLRVPGSIPGDNLFKRSALGADVRWVYSPIEAVKIAEDNPKKNVVFLGVGFETSAPGTALCVLEAMEKDLSNFFLLCLLKRTAPVMRALINEPGFDINGFICPGHVAAVTGYEAFSFLPDEYGLPAVVSGFDTDDLIHSLFWLFESIKEGSALLKNEYERAVSAAGNIKAQEIMDTVFVPTYDIWRGIGMVSDSGYLLREEYCKFDAKLKFKLNFSEAKEPPGCRCSDIICGKASPKSCQLFGERCTPDDPIGPCMVSGEGACAAAYKYADKDITL